ncbi:MAG: chorismate mutase [Clostridia bacterium]|jgi:chorismate mutase/prephenate dehydratase|nr:chorismate mutase [Clostridia bacterium]
MKIEELRTKIDAIDTQLVELLKERLGVAASIAEYKKLNNLPVLDKSRERELLNKVSKQAGEEFDSETRIFFNDLMGISRAYQSKLLGEKSSYSDAIENAISSTEKIFPESAMVACQGVEGAFSQQACEKIFPNPSIVFLNTWEGVFHAVDSGFCRYGILPLENSNAGSVNRIYDLLAQFNFSIVRSTRIHVNHSVLAKKGVKLEDIKDIYSHEQAINQCSEFLNTLKNVNIHVCDNTAMAAKLVAESDRTDVAALSSKACADLYNLNVLKEAVQNDGNNYTRFICISKKLEIYPGATKTSLMIVAPHKPGSLYSVLSKFNSLGVNVIKLESRPIPGSDFEFMFYFDIDVSVYSPKFLVLLGQLESEAEQFQYLGSYIEVI